jgi:hypothetical protein
VILDLETALPPTDYFEHAISRLVFGEAVMPLAFPGFHFGLARELRGSLRAPSSHTDLARELCRRGECLPGPLFVGGVEYLLSYAPNQRIFPGIFAWKHGHLSDVSL